MATPHDETGASSTHGDVLLSILVADIDRFTHLIETHGQAAGERVVRAVTEVLEARTGGGRVLERSGADQFVLDLPGTDEASARRLAEEIRAEVAALDVPWQPLTVCVGVATGPPGAVHRSGLLDDARRALARAKELGRNRVHSRSRQAPVAGPTGRSTGVPARDVPLGVVVLAKEHRRPVRSVLELSGLEVLEFDAPRDVQLPADIGDGPVLLVTAVREPGQLAERLASLGALLEAGSVSIVVFVADAAEEGPLPADRPGATVLRGEPSAEVLLPLVSGLLSEARRAGRERIAPVEGGFGSPLLRAGAPLTAARILIVDDERASRDVLGRTLAAIGFHNLGTAEDGQEALAAVAESPPDLVMLDLDMPKMDGFAVLDGLQPLLAGDGFLPVLVVTGNQERAHRQRALSSGAKDFLHKPFDVSELGARVVNLLETRKLHLESRHARQSLEERVRLRTSELGLAKDEIIFRLARAAEYRDDQTGRHAARVGAAAGVLAAALGLDSARCELIQRAAPLHDVGKIGIPDAVLLKPGKLSEEELAVMRRHTLIGAELLARSTSDVIAEAHVIALTHHERWDGGGYPERLAGERIPVQGRIVAMADALDALTHERPYKPAYPFEESMRRLLVDAGSAFDPAVVSALRASAFRLRDILLEGGAGDSSPRPGPRS